MGQIIKIAVISAITLVIGIILGNLGDGNAIMAFFRSQAFFVPEIVQIGILSAILWQAHLLLQENASNHLREKRKSTLEFILSIWSVYEPARRALDLRFDGEAVQHSEMTIKDRVRLVTLLNCMNIVSVGIERDAIDEDLITDLYSEHFQAVNTKYQDFITTRKTELGSDPWSFYASVVERMNSDS